MNRSVLGGLLIPLLGACALFVDDGVVCTEIGCANGLTVRLPVLPSAPFKVELITSIGPDQIVSEAYECTAGNLCAQEFLFSDKTPSNATIRVTTSAGVRITEVANIMYRQSQPNGPACPPLCANATVVAQLPG